MSSEFLNDVATLVTYALWELYNALSAATLTLTAAAPIGSFRVSVTLSASGVHTVCAGTVTVGSEVLTFTAAGKKTTTTYLTSLPIITTSGLDCNIKIVATDINGNDLQKETDTTIAVDWDDSTSYYPDSQGGFSRSDSNCETDTLTAKIGDQIVHNRMSYSIKNIKNGEQTLGGIVLTKIIQFGGGAPVASAWEPVELVVEDMQKAIYDINNDGIVDKAFGILVLAEMPTDLSAYPEGSQFMVKGQVYTVVIE